MDSAKHELINMRDVVDRLKSATGTSLDQDLAKLMEVESRNIAQWKARNSVPTEKLAEFCLSMGYDLQYILTGKITKQTKQKQPTSANYSAFPELEMIFKEAGSLWKRLDTPNRFKMASKISKELQTMKESTKKPKPD